MLGGERTLRLLLAAIQAWLDDPEVTEVCINQPGEVWVETRGGWTQYECPSLKFDTLDAIATLAAAMTNQDVGPERPLCATKLPDGQRVQICRPPAVAPGLMSITIRRPASFRPTVKGLADTGLFEKQNRRAVRSELAELHEAGVTGGFLVRAVQEHKNILICGATGSGKTTLARALIDAVPEHERLITIEDTPEWRDLPQQNRVSLFYSKGDQGSARVQSEELLEASLRMRPDRVLMQELRDGAAFTYLRGVAAGHPGSITTCHASSCEGAFDALRLMVRQHPAGSTMADTDVRELLRQMIDVIVHCERVGKVFTVTDVYWKEACHAHA